jgi:hypothetical protein
MYQVLKIKLQVLRRGETHSDRGRVLGEIRTSAALCKFAETSGQSSKEGCGGHIKITGGRFVADCVLLACRTLATIVSESYQKLPTVSEMRRVGLQLPLTQGSKGRILWRDEAASLPASLPTLTEGTLSPQL